MVDAYGNNPCIPPTAPLSWVDGVFFISMVSWIFCQGVWSWFGTWTNIFRKHLTKSIQIPLQEIPPIIFCSLPDIARPPYAAEVAVLLVLFSWLALGVRRGNGEVWDTFWIHKWQGNSRKSVSPVLVLNRKKWWWWWWWCIVRQLARMIFENAATGWSWAGEVQI